MIKTDDGTVIYLDNAFESNGKSGLSGALNVSWITMALFLMVPIQILIWSGKLASVAFLNVEIQLWSLMTMVAICVACVIFFRVCFFRLRHPMAYHWVQISGLSFRMFYVSSLMWLLLSNVSWLAYFCVVLLWVFSEVNNAYEVRRVSDEEINKAFRKRFRFHSEGDVLYNPLVSVKELCNTGRKSWVKWRDRFETFGAVVLVIIGPALFVRSQLYRDNFEPRFLIIACVALVLALAVRSMTTEVAIARRALKLKQQERLTS
ncbi:hypothetical protein ACUY1T_02545 [Billgrantia sp. Q4P2]|uniref:hypothetical protein n=1 Tax=Billgrantia sp. Q4P2 TaxID=3463857 RepID=UPI0040579BB6